MKDLQREILTQVAAGTISAEEGAARLEALESPAPASIATDSPASEAVRHVKVVSRFGNTEIVGDPSVTSAVADGPHRARQDGDTLVIEQSPVNEDTSFEFSRPQARVVVNGFEFGRRLAIRMNPSLPLTTNVQAGNLRMQGLNGPIVAEVQAGNCKVGEFRGPINLSVMAGNIDAYGRIDSGKSSIRCEMGQVKVSLARDSSVRINARTTMGKVAIEGDGIKRDSRDVTVGTGAGTLDLECTMGNIKVSVP
ncbi:MAG: hypothetical protein E6I11_13435 [Chloroflexi bacterium]|nr:MAG: hypothetical protein E6I11_13435 [Chloroflexota bacterium]